MVAGTVVVVAGTVVVVGSDVVGGPVNDRVPYSGDWSTARPWTVAASATIQAATSSGARAGARSRRRAATPATWGAAIEVPFITAVPVVLWMPADTMEWPGAHTSMHGPTLEKSATASVEVRAPTVMARGARAGDLVQASAP